MELIRTKGYVDYFLVVADIVRRRSTHCGRGSDAASLVSYLLGITHVDPIEHNLLFGRFLNPHRQDPPDIDVDFPWDERDELMEELKDAYGPERMASVANHVGFGGRAAVREVAIWVQGWPITRKEVLTREGNSMEFVSFEDTTTIYETVFFPKAYRRFCQELDMGCPCLLFGRVESEFGAESLHVHRMQPIPKREISR